ncbi:hypothetical protein [uncultured Helicobacter sp.]|uniref:hypothetical protein n=1 Tax=uncultured Helicobacter sp. TaxID=175537 RepID=UPI003750C3B7
MTNFLKKLRFVVSDSNPTESNQDSQKQNLESSFSESKQLPESITSKNLIEALPNINNSACASTIRAQLQNCAIFATQKSNQCVGAIAPTTPRPLRGVQSLGQGGSSASATIALEAEKRGTLPVCRAEGLQAKRSKNSGDFFGALRVRGGDNTPFCEKTQDSKKLESIRENTTLRNRESTESSVVSESKTFTESSAEILKDAQLTESSPLDSKTITESKEILKNEKTQILLSPCATPSNLLFIQNPIKKLLTQRCGVVAGDLGILAEILGLYAKGDTHLAHARIQHRMRVSKPTRGTRRMQRIQNRPSLQGHILKRYRI